MAKKEPQSHSYRNDLEAALARSQAVEKTLASLEQQGEVDKAEIRALEHQLEQQHAETAKLRELLGLKEHGSGSASAGARRGPQGEPRERWWIYILLGLGIPALFAGVALVCAVLL